MKKKENTYGIKSDKLIYLQPMLLSIYIQLENGITNSSINTTIEDGSVTLEDWTETDLPQQTIDF